MHWEQIRKGCAGASEGASMKIEQIETIVLEMPYKKPLITAIS